MNSGQLKTRFSYKNCSHNRNCNRAGIRLFVDCTSANARLRRIDYLPLGKGQQEECGDGQDAWSICERPVGGFPRSFVREGQRRERWERPGCGRVANERHPPRDLSARDGVKLKLSGLQSRAPGWNITLRPETRQLARSPSAHPQNTSLIY